MRAVAKSRSKMGCWRAGQRGGEVGEGRGRPETRTPKAERNPKPEVPHRQPPQPGGWTFRVAFDGRLIQITFCGFSAAERCSALDVGGIRRVVTEPRDIRSPDFNGYVVQQQLF